MIEDLLSLRDRVRSELMDTRVVRSLFDGRLDAAAYVRYLQNVYCYAQHSPVVMALAAARCTDTHPELSAYLLKHAREEMGHDRWAFDDLRDLGVSEEAIRASQPVPSCEAMIAHMYYTAAHANPIGLFGWMYVLEAVGSDLGTAVARQLTMASAGSTAGEHRFVSRHGITDVDHTQELAEQIGTYVRSAEDQRDVLRVAETIVWLYARIFREIGQEKERWA
jgi:pyrroloquinoline quinone (PQQ) biosynthesis protein C